MNYSKFRFTLDMHKHQSQVSIPVMCGDTAVELYISLTDGGKPYTIGGSCWALLIGNKPDGTTFRHCCVIEGGGSHIRYEFQADTSDLSGATLCEVRLYGTNGILTAPCFTIVVDERIPHNDDSVSTEVISAIDRVFLNEIERVEAEHQREEAEKQRAKLDEGRFEYLASLLYPALDGVLALQDGLINMQTVYSLNHDKESYTCIGGLNIEALTVVDAVNDKPVTTIAPRAFKGYDKLERIALSSNIKTIGKDAFADCASLTAIYVPWAKGQVAGAPWGASDEIIQYNYRADEGLVYALSRDGTYYSCIGFEGLQANVIIPQTFNELPVKEIGESVFENKTFVTSIVIPNGVEKIGRSAFKNTRITSVRIPDSVISLGVQAFYDCRTLSSVTIGKGVTILPNQVFGHCSFTSVIIPEGVMELDGNTFYECTSLKTVIFNGTPSSINTDAFLHCTSLKDIYVPWANGMVAGAKWGATNATIRYNCEVGDDGLVYTLANELKTRIGTTYYTGQCYSVSGYVGERWYVVVPDTFNGLPVTSIGEEAFRDNKIVTSISLGANLIVIGYAAFMTSRITSITIPKSVQEIEAHGLRTGYLKEVTFEANSQLQFIRSSAFYDAKMSTISIPASVIGVDEKAFNKCSALTKVTFEGKVAYIDPTAFSNCETLFAIYVPWNDGDVSWAKWGAPDYTDIYYNSKV